MKNVVIDERIKQINGTKQNEEFAKRLSYVLKERNVTGSMLSKMIETDKSKAYGWLRGEYLPNLTSLMKICLALNVSADFLLFGEGNV